MTVLVVLLGAGYGVMQYLMTTPLGKPGASGAMLAVILIAVFGLIALVSYVRHAAHRSCAMRCALWDVQAPARCC